MKKYEMMKSELQSPTTPSVKTGLPLQGRLEDHTDVWSIHEEYFRRHVSQCSCCILTEVLEDHLLGYLLFLEHKSQL